MSNERNTDSTTAPSTQPGPDLLTERTLSGIFVHFLGLVTGVVAPGIVYLVTDHEFTRENARNAANWQLFYLLTFLAVIVVFAIAAALDSIAPDVFVLDALLLALLLLLFVGVFALSLLFLLSVAFSLTAMAKAIFGTAWTYPIAPDLVGRIAARRSGTTRWWLVVAGYVCTAPVVFGYVLWTAIADPASDAPVFLAVGLLFVLVVASLVALVAIYKDATALAATAAAWQPNWIPYLAVPIGVGVLTYPVAATVFQSANPSGDAVYGYAVALWVVAVVYLANRRRHRDGT